MSLSRLSRVTGTSARARVTRLSKGMWTPLHLWVSTWRPATLASQGKAMAARNAWPVDESRAARSSTRAGLAPP
eukprot:402467-Pyramimonas_sp.AAC.1